MRKASARPATLDYQELVGVWSTAVWILAAAVLLATFDVY